MYHQNWLEEMDQIGCCNGSRGSSNKNNRSKLSSSFSITAMKKCNRGRIRIRNKGGGSWRSNSSVVAAFWMIVSVGSSVAVMAYQNDLSAISGSRISGTSKSNRASSRHGCIWSRTDSGTATTTTSTTSAASLNDMSGIYSSASGGNNPFRHQQSEPSFPALSSSSSMSPYHSSSFLTSAFAGGPSSTSGGSGVLTLDCYVRTLNADFQNYTALFTREQVEQARAARVKCSDKLFFESLLSPNQTLFQLRNLRQVQIDSCKIRKVPKGVFSMLNQLRRLEIQTDNVQWSPSVGLEIDSEAFQGLGQLETLNLVNDNIWTLDPNVFCPMKSLKSLNVSHNRLTDIDELFGVDSGANCAQSVQNLDLSFNSLRRVSSSSFLKLPRLIELRLQNNLLEGLEDTAFQGLGQLRLLNLSSNRLVALPTKIFTSSTGNLRELYLQNNSISALSPKLFTGLNILLLDLSRNSLSSQWVKDFIFEDLVRLIVLNLSYNKLTYIDSSTFKNLISLQALHLNNNEIESIHPEALLSLKNLHILDLSSNRLTSLDGQLSNLFVLRQLYLDHNKISWINDNAFKNLSLEDLGIADNLLMEVPTALRNANLDQLKTLDLGENRIETVTNQSFPLKQLYGLRLVNNRITELPSNFCQSMKKLRALNIAQNQISKISSNAFYSCSEIRALRLDSNSLEVIPLLANQLPSLLWLNVSQNNIKGLDCTLIPPTLEWINLSFNKLETIKNGNMSKLRVLDASYNRLSNLDYTVVPTTLETLRLNNNNIKHVAPNTFIRSFNMRRIELSGNDIENLPLDSIRLPQIPKDKPLPELFIGGNPFLCDCEMEWMTRMNQLAVVRQYPTIADMDVIVCRRSLSLSNRDQVIHVLESRQSDFLCAYKNHCFLPLCGCCDFDACDCNMECPIDEGCSCYHDNAWASNIVECSNLNFSQIPSRIPMDATEIYLDGNELKELKSHIFIGKKNTRVLFLNNSQVETISNKTFNGLKSLEVLRLNDNYLRQLNVWDFADLQSLHELYLQNNLISFIAKETFAQLSFLQVIRLDGNSLVSSESFNVWELSRNGYLNSVMLANNPWSCDCAPFRQWVAASPKKTIFVDFALAKCRPTEEQQQQLKKQQQQQDGNSNNSSAIMNSGGSAITTTTGASKLASGATTLTITHPTISSMCAPLTQKGFNYDHDNPALVPSAASSSSSNGGSNHVVLTNNHISSMGGAARSNLGSLQLSGPYHHAHLENQAGNYHEGFPQNENIIATTAAAGGGGLRRSKTGHDDDDDSSGNSTFFILLVTCSIILLVAAIAFLVGLVTFRKRGQMSQSSSSWFWCFAKCGINGSSPALPKCLSSSANEGGGSGTPSLGDNSGDNDSYYFSDQEKLFDAYFIYSQKDQEFVDKMTCELDAPIVVHTQEQHYYPGATFPGTKKLRLCLHYRDLCLAADNPWSSEMILSACDASKRVVLVVSNNFLNGECSNTHFKTCIKSVIQQHSRKLIVIKLPPVSDQSVSNLCSVVAAAPEQQLRLQQPRNNGDNAIIGSASNKQSSFTPSTTKLEWGDKNFWPKLRLLLPTPPQILSSGNNNRNGITPTNFTTISSVGTTNSQLPYTTNLNHNGMNFVNAVNNGPILPYQIPMIASHHHHYHQPSDPVSTLGHPIHPQQHFTMLNWTGQQQQQHHQGIPSIPLNHSSSVHPVPSQLTPQQFGYSNIDGFQNNMSSQQSILLAPQQQPLHFSSSNNNRQSHRLHHPNPNNHLSSHINAPGNGQHIHSLSQLSNMSSSKSPVEANYSSSAVSSGNEFDHVYSTLDSPLESPCSDLGPGHVAGQFEGAIISGAQVNRHQIQHSTSSGISSGSDATSGTGGCHRNGGSAGNGGGGIGGPPMYFV